MTKGALADLTARLLERFDVGVDAQRRAEAIERTQAWLAREKRPAQELPLEARPIGVGELLEDLLPRDLGGANSRNVYFRLRAHDDVRSWISGSGVSLGREISTHLALASALLTDTGGGSEPGATLSFVHFEITGARALLHPPTAQISPLELRGRYLFLRLVTEWAVQKLLARCGLPEMNCCWLGVARALLLMPSSRLSGLQQEADEVGRPLAGLRTPLRLLVRWAPIADAEWEDGDLRVPLAAGFSDKPEGRSWIDPQTDPVPSPDEAAADLHLSDGLANGWPLHVDAATAPADEAHEPLHPLLSEWLVWSPAGAAGAATLPRALLRCPDATPQPRSAWMRQPLQQSTGLAFLRADIKGYKTVMHEAGGSMLPGMQTRCTYNQGVLMNAAARVCAGINDTAAPEDRVLFMHAFSDDAVICGPAPQVERAAAALQAAAGHVAHGLDIGTSPLPPGATAADGSRGALHALAENRAARLAALASTSRSVAAR